MTKIRCVLKRCKYNKNGYCTKKRVHLIRGKCYDFKVDYEEFKGLTGRVICTYVMCEYNNYYRCMRDEIFVTSDGCVIRYEQDGDTER